jgi:hypothetical protein
MRSAASARNTIVVVHQYFVTTCLKQRDEP